MNATYTKTADGWMVKVPGAWAMCKGSLEMHSISVAKKNGSFDSVLLKSVLSVGRDYAICSFCKMP